ncbi:MAG TPA: DUF6632 domain-containing protein [Candidatus Sulfotelmatobacter sp.]|nr:DUF6632 domain-containing protein [Candidatus Sulfotelmatobacter sp.]
MRRERTLKVVLVVVGLLFTRSNRADDVFLARAYGANDNESLCHTRNFLLLAVRDPSANRSLMAFAGWANLAHAAVMAAQEYRNVIERRELAGVVVFAIVGVMLVALAPSKQPVEKASAWSRRLVH